MDTQTDECLARTRISLEGLSVGDAFGERFFSVRSDFVEEVIVTRTVPQAPWPYTDDTEMALSIFSVLRQCGTVDQDALARSFAEHHDSRRAYGAAMQDALPRIRAGESWREVARGHFGGQGSFGNGAAMRVAPLGAYFADDLDAVVEQARRSAEVTHAHPEAIAGAIAVAAAAAYAWQLRGVSPPPARQDFLDLILPHVPTSEVASKVRHARDLSAHRSIWPVVNLLGNGSRVLAQDTVPFVLWSAAQRLNSYEDALWLIASGLGDVDTTCAMVGGIVALYTGLDGIPPEWRNAREPLPDWPFLERDGK